MKPAMIVASLLSVRLEGGFWLAAALESIRQT